MQICRMQHPTELHQQRGEPPIASPLAFGPLLNSFADLFCLALFVVLDLRIGCWEREPLSILGPNHFE